MRKWPGTEVINKARVAGKVAVVGVHCAFDRIVSTKATKPRDVPRSFLDITPQWLTAVLCSQIPGAEVLDVKSTGGSVGTTTRQGLALTLNRQAADAGIPTRLFTKSTDLYRQRLLLGLSGGIKGEICFYLKIRPHLEIEAPRGYYACLSHASWRSMILMEDVAVTKGARFISTETHISRPMIEDSLANMAKWHGAFWDHPRFSADLHALRSPTEFLRNLDGFLSIAERAKAGLRSAQSVVPASLLARTDDVYEALHRSFEFNRSMPKTLLHGDPHVGQTYITRDGRIGLGDWSEIMQGGWAYDFTYALVSSLTVADRRAWQEDLLRFYLDRLHAAGGPSLDFDDAWLSYRRHAPWPYLCWLMTLVGASAMTPEMQPKQVSLDIVSRMGHAIEDLDTLSAFERRAS